jgi:hypothetical protein
MSQEQNCSKKWKMMKDFHDRFSNGPKNSSKHSLLKEDGSYAASDQERADVFASRLESVHQTANHPLFDDEFKNRVSEFVDLNQQLFKNQPHVQAEIGDDDASVAEISMSEFKDVINKVRKKKSSAGEDKIDYVCLQNLPDSITGFLCQALTKCLRSGYFPDVWKNAKVILLHKPGKPPADPKNYRPISLLSCIGKMFERIVNIRLTTFLDKRSFFNQNQTGYRKARSTQEHILRLSEAIHNGFKEKKCTISIFLDCKAAFDAVWLDGMRYKLFQSGLPCKMIRLLSSFLTDRSLIVSEGDAQSIPVMLQAGTPQGSCLSPTIFIVYVNDVPNSNQTTMSQYADDINIFTSDRDVLKAQEHAQRSLNEIQRWCSKWRIRLSPAKIKVILFTRCPTHKRTPVILSLFGSRLTVSEEADFLGARFSSTMTWKPQFDLMSARAWPRINSIRKLAGLQKNLQSSTLFKIYLAFVRPVYEYAAVAFISASNVHFNKIQSLQNSVVKSILQLPSYISNKLAHNAAAIPFLADHLKAFAKKRVAIMNAASPLIKDLILDHQNFAHIPSHKSPLDVILSED